MSLEAEYFKANTRWWDRVLVVNTARSYRQLNSEGISRNLRKLQSQILDTRQEPQRGQLESSLVHSLSMVARICLDELRFRDFAVVCRNMIEILNRKAERKRAANQFVPPDNTAWSTITGFIGEYKWKYPASEINEIMPLSEMLFRHLKAQIEVRQNILRMIETNSVRAGNIFINLGWDAAAIVGAVTRFDAGHAELVRQVLDQCHGGSLSNPDLPYYWKTKLVSELYSAAPDSDRVLSYLESQTDRALKIGPAWDSKDAYLASQAREKGYFLQLIRMRRAGLYMYQTG